MIPEGNFRVTGGIISSAIVVVLFSRLRVSFDFSNHWDEARNGSELANDATRRITGNIGVDDSLATDVW